MTRANKSWRGHLPFVGAILGLGGLAIALLFLRSWLVNRDAAVVQLQQQIDQLEKTNQAVAEALAKRAPPIVVPDKPTPRVTDYMGPCAHAGDVAPEIIELIPEGPVIVLVDNPDGLWLEWTDHPWMGSGPPKRTACLVHAGANLDVVVYETGTNAALGRTRIAWADATKERIVQIIAPFVEHP